MRIFKIANAQGTPNTSTMMSTIGMSKYLDGRTESLEGISALVGYDTLSGVIEWIEVGEVESNAGGVSLTSFRGDIMTPDLDGNFESDGWDIDQSSVERIQDDINGSI